jgi:C-8 sterol isomerase
MKRLTMALALAALVACGTACREVAAANGRPAAPANFGAVKLEQVQQFLNENGKADARTIVKTYNWIKAAFHYEPADQTYEFSPEELQQIAQLGVGLPVGEAWNVIHTALMARHPGKIAATPRWTFNSAGAAFCQIAIVYASTKEYVAFFGTPIGADGFSGRYDADVWDLMVDGNMWTYEPGQFEPTIYKAGDMAYLPQGSGKGVQYVDHSWMIDYGRGNIISMFPFGIIAPTLFITLDYQSAWQEFVDFAKLVIQNLIGK